MQLHKRRAAKRNGLALCISFTGQKVITPNFITGCRVRHWGAKNCSGDDKAVD